MTSFVDVTGGMNPLQSAQALNTAAEATRNQIDWANQQALKNIQSAHTNDDGSLDHFGFIHSASKAGIAPAAIKAWLDNQNATNAAAVTQSQTNMLLRALNLDPNALRDQSKLPGQPGAGGMNSVDGVKIPVGQSIQYNNEQGAGAPTGKSTLNLDSLPDTSEAVRAKAEAAKANGAAAFVPSQSSQNPGQEQQSAGAGAFAPKPVTGSKAMTSGGDAASLLDTKTEQMTKRATAWGKGSPAVASIQKEIGLTGKDVDGTWGPKTAAAYRKYLQNNPNAGVVPVGTQLQFKSDVGDTTPQVVVNASNPEANSGGTFTAPPPQDNSMSYTATQDKRSILERLADSGSGSPTMPNMNGNGASENSTIFNYDKVVKTGNLNLKQGVDVTLAKLGKTQDQAGVDSILDQAAQGVPVPTPQMKDGHLDVFGYQQEVQAYGAKVLAAKNAAAKALADGNTTALGEILGRDQYAMAKANQEKEFSQVSHPAIKGYLPSPAEKQNLTDASGAAKEIVELMKHVPSPQSAEWGAFKLMMGKSLIKAMNLPVGEGMVDAVGAQMQNGVNIGDIVKTAAEGLASGGLGQAAANAAANGMVQAYQTAMGINSVGGAKLLAKGATEFIRNKWSEYGKGDKFDECFPEYNGEVTSSPAPKASGAGAFAPRPKASAPKAAHKKGPLSGRSF